MSMVCYHEVIYDGPVNNDETILVSGEEWLNTEAVNSLDTDEEIAEYFVPYGAKVKQIQELCDDELLEHLELYYDVLKRVG